MIAFRASFTNLISFLISEITTFWHEIFTISKCTYKSQRSVAGTRTLCDNHDHDMIKRPRDLRDCKETNFLINKNFFCQRQQFSLEKCEILSSSPS